MESYSKYIAGFVVQNFVKKDGEFVCTDQHFTASDDTTYEDENGKVIDLCDIDEVIDGEVYHPMNMEQPTE